jgi:hypothetical protein
MPNTAFHDGILHGLKLTYLEPSRELIETDNYTKRLAIVQKRRDSFHFVRQLQYSIIILAGY